ncbi:ribonuclease PH [bacterium]|nr:ribonuclease PH [bacterium]
MRSYGRTNSQLRPVTITPRFLDSPLGSVLIKMGKTTVLCSTTIEDQVPRWMKGEGRGWVTAEYSMLPSSAGLARMPRESSRGKVSGRTHEIQRLIGRAFRAVCDLSKLGERTVWIDCDVLQADGGTRTASITGGFVALRLAVARMLEEGIITEDPLYENVAAISVGVVAGELMLDLDYAEDSSAEVDMNIVMTHTGKLIEIQGTAEEKPFSKKKLIEMISLAQSGIEELCKLQEHIIYKED